MSPQCQRQLDKMQAFNHFIAWINLTIPGQAPKPGGIARTMPKLRTTRADLDVGTPVHCSVWSNGRTFHGRMLFRI